MEMIWLGACLANESLLEKMNPDLMKNDDIARAIHSIKRSGTKESKSLQSLFLKFGIGETKDYLRSLCHRIETLGKERLLLSITKLVAVGGNNPSSVNARLKKVYLTVKGLMENADG